MRRYSLSLFRSLTLLLSKSHHPYHRSPTGFTASTTDTMASSTTTTTTPWIAHNAAQAKEAKDRLGVWPLDEANAALLNEVHPRGYVSSTSEPHPIYDLIAIGAGAGGLVSSKQSARRGAKSALISEHLAGGDCLNVGCVPSKALLHAAKLVRNMRTATKELGLEPDSMRAFDFGRVMKNLREKRAQIAPADGHAGSAATGAHVYQGRGVFTSPHTVKVGDQELKFSTAVIATGGRPMVPSTIEGLRTAPYTTNEKLFNLENVLPPRVVVLGAGVIALEMAQALSTLGAQVVVVQRSSGPLFSSKQGDPEAGILLREALEKDGVKFLTGAVAKRVETLRDRDPDDTTILPLMKVSISVGDNDVRDYECECLLVAAGRVANVENLGLEAAGVDFKVGQGILVNDKSQSVSNPNVFAVGDCVLGVPRLTHASGEMAKLVVQNSLFGDDWKLSSLVIPAVMYTEPEYATVGISSQDMADKNGLEVDVFRAGLEHNDRAILESSNVGFCKILCKAGSDEILGATIVAERAGEMINEVSLAMKNNLGLRAIGRNIHPYPSTGEAVMGCGVQFINANWDTLN